MLTREINNPLSRASLMQVNTHPTAMIKISLSCGQQHFDNVRRYCPLRGAALRVPGEENNGDGGVGVGTVAKRWLHTSDSLNEQVTHSRYRSFRRAQPHEPTCLSTRKCDQRWR